MLTKSSARIFFIGGTMVFSLVFLGLTYDTVRQVPKRSNQEEMNESVRRGHTIWNDNNCMGCHTILGEGAYYAPELTKVVERRGKPWIRIFIKDPQAMFPGRRKMVQYDFDDDQISDLIAFFEWVGRIDANGFPPEPDLGVLAANTVAASQPGPAATSVSINQLAMPDYMKTVCTSCHAYGGSGGKVGPPLDGMAAKYDRQTLDLWLADPQKVKPGTAMPNLKLSDEVRNQIINFLLQSPGETP